MAVGDWENPRLVGGGGMSFSTEQHLKNLT